MKIFMHNLILFNLIFLILSSCNNQKNSDIGEKPPIIFENNNTCWKVVNPTPQLARNIMKVNECNGRTWGLYEDPKTRQTFWSEIE